MAQYETSFERRRRRVRFTIRQAIPQGAFRLSVVFSNRHLQAQIIKDSQHATVASVFTGEKELVGTVEKSTVVEQAGTLLAERAKAAGVERVVLDRGGRQYHGKLKRFADAVRASGLRF